MLLFELSQYHFSTPLVKCKDVSGLSSASGQHEAFCKSAIQPTSFLNFMMSPFFSGTHWNGPAKVLPICKKETMLLG